ncbi:MAG TPA: phosphotransferase [Ktedonobacterales bacterium]|nr:phosphotransferase [Ktedonobacterales bacterium]
MPGYERAMTDRALTDPALPALRQLIDPSGATRMLRAAWKVGLWPPGLPAPEVRAVHVLRYHAGSRCTLWLALDGWPASSCIAKIHRRGNEATADVLRRLSHAGFASGQCERVPELVAALPDCHLLVLQVAPGAPIHRLTPDALPEAAVRAAYWLAAFHSTCLSLPPAYALRHPLVMARRWHARLERAAPELADDAAHLWDALVAASPAWPPQARLIHGDFGAEHLFIAPDATTVIDWDRCRPGDQVEDAGRFVGSLYARAARERAGATEMAAAAASFCAAYCGAQPAAAASLPFYVALACLRRASRAACAGADDRDTAGSARYRRRAARLARAGQATLATIAWT